MKAKIVKKIAIELIKIILGAAHEHKGQAYKKGDKLEIHPNQLEWFKKHNGAKKA